MDKYFAGTTILDFSKDRYLLANSSNIDIFDTTVELLQEKIDVGRVRITYKIGNLLGESHQV